MSHRQLAYLLAKITLGLNFLMHGLVRIPKLAEFAETMANGFRETLLPYSVTLGFAYVLPFIELGLGILLLAGFRTRKALTAAAILMMLLIFGSSLQEEWGTVGTQMLYALFIFFLIFYLEYDPGTKEKSGNTDYKEP